MIKLIPLLEVKVIKPQHNKQLANFLNQNKEEFIKKHLEWIGYATNYDLNDLDFVLDDKSGDRSKNEYVVYLLSADGGLGWEGSFNKEYLIQHPDEEEQVEKIKFRELEFYVFEYNI